MDCDAIPSCIEMGYTQDSCAGGKGIRCPFDENKFYCAGVKQLPDAPEPVITPEDWTAECADKIDHCTAYNNDCQCTACEEDYNLADNTCVSKCDKSVDVCAKESKTFNAELCTCESCPTNYKFNATTKSCDLCTRNIPYCYRYKDNCTCNYCGSRYKVASDGTCVCAKNVEGCTSYTSEAEGCKCTACQSGYELYENSDYDVLTCEKIACNLDTFAEEGNSCPDSWDNTNKGYNSCVPGAVLYDDFQCYLPNEVPEGAVALGIVVHSMPLYDETTKTYSDTHNRVRAIAIDDNSETSLPWSENLYGDEETNCYYEAQLGWENTDCMIEAGAEESSAAVYCKAYHKTEADKGKWYLPAIDELVWALGTNERWKSQKPCCVIWGLYRNNAPAGTSPVDYLASTFYEPDNGHGRLSKPLEYWTSSAHGDKWNPSSQLTRSLKFATGFPSSSDRNKVLRVRCMIQVAVPYRQMSWREKSEIMVGYRKYLTTVKH